MYVSYMTVAQGTVRREADRDLYGTSRVRDWCLRQRHSPCRPCCAWFSLDFQLFVRCTTTVLLCQNFLFVCNVIVLKIKVEWPWWRISRSLIKCRAMMIFHRYVENDSMQEWSSNDLGDVSRRKCLCEDIWAKRVASVKFYEV